MATIKSEYVSIEDFYAKNWLEDGVHKVSLRHGQYDEMPNWRWEQSGERWVTMMGGHQLAVSRDQKGTWKYGRAHYPRGTSGGSDDGFTTPQEAMDNASHGYGARCSVDELRRLKAMLSGKSCSHEKRAPDLADWVVRCLDCGSVLRDVGETEGNQIFSHLTGVSTNS